MGPAVKTTPCAISDFKPVSQFDPPPTRTQLVVVEHRAGSGQILNVVAFVMSCSVTNRVLAQLDVLRK